MPRRKATKSRGSSKPRPTNRDDARLKKWNKLSDIPLDEEDQFHASRDKILLEGERGLNSEEDGDEDEVFGLKGIEGPSSDAGDEDDEGEDDGVEEFGGTPLQKKQKKQGKDKAKKTKGLSDSEGSEEETWGRTNSAYYSSNAAQLESDDEEGNDLEEQEAKRIQNKLRDGMSDDDFGLNDIIDISGDDGDEQPLVPPIAPALPKDPKLLLRHLEKDSPETLALARDWEDTANNLARTREKISQLQSKDPDAVSLGMIHLHYQALLTYTTTLAFYLHLRSSTKYAQKPDLLKSHPILNRLLTLKQSLTTLEDLDFAVGSDDEDASDPNTPESEEDDMLDAEQLWRIDKKKGLDSNELEELLKDAISVDAAADGLVSIPKQPKKKRKVSSTSSATLPTFDLTEPEFASSKSKNTHPSNNVDFDPYGEATTLQHADAVDKTAHKKTLRFHTSKIESASARRQGARNQAVGGDDDLPYRERKKEKEVRLAKEARVKARGQGGEDLNDVEPDRKRRREESSDGEDPDSADGYYELVKKKSKEKKEHKKAEYEALQDADGPGRPRKCRWPRSLTRAILANKGLTPHRPKSVRNPRVKKRQKFEKAKKKVSSQKAVYKGGLSNTGRYDGEMSGISKVVKSIRLG
ncbi:Sas10 C-terminal domain-containing protein [Infundibulicybe gibba]|nr:Sas10 C-terminal domain-containing protein [Infundibulicybe gibba]